MQTPRRQVARRAALVLAATALLAQGALARPRPEPRLAQLGEEPALLVPAQRGAISLAQATAMAQSRYRGQVVRAQTVHNGDRAVHEIRILGDDGRVRTVRIDAQTGAFL
jgi:uncharacterized membrane protein YkoI